ncbi:hypothetical protein FF38_05537, partial [Lucilia cuprina]
MGNAWTTVIAAELLGALSGLGYVALNSSRTLDTDILLVSMITIGLIGALCSPREDGDDRRERPPRHRDQRGRRQTAARCTIRHRCHRLDDRDARGPDDPVDRGDRRPPARSRTGAPVAVGGRREVRPGPRGAVRRRDARRPCPGVARPMAERCADRDRRGGAAGVHPRVDPRRPRDRGARLRAAALHPALRLDSHRGPVDGREHVGAGARRLHRRVSGDRDQQPPRRHAGRPSAREGGAHDRSRLGADPRLRCRPGGRRIRLH